MYPPSEKINYGLDLSGGVLALEGGLERLHGRLEPADLGAPASRGTATGGRTALGCENERQPVERGDQPADHHVGDGSRERGEQEIDDQGPTFRAPRRRSDLGRVEGRTDGERAPGQRVGPDREDARLGSVAAERQAADGGRQFDRILQLAVVDVPKKNCFP